MSEFPSLSELPVAEFPSVSTTCSSEVPSMEPLLVSTTGSSSSQSNVNDKEPGSLVSTTDASSQSHVNEEEPEFVEKETSESPTTEVSAQPTYVEPAITLINAVNDDMLSFTQQDTLLNLVQGGVKNLEETKIEPSEKVEQVLEDANDLDGYVLTSETKDALRNRVRAVIKKFEERESFGDLNENKSQEAESTSSSLPNEKTTEETKNWKDIVENHHSLHDPLEPLLNTVFSWVVFVILYIQQIYNWLLKVYKSGRSTPQDSESTPPFLPNGKVTGDIKIWQEGNTLYIEREKDLFELLGDKTATCVTYVLYIQLFYNWLLKVCKYGRSAAQDMLTKILEISALIFDCVEGMLFDDEEHKHNCATNPVCSSLSLTNPFQTEETEDLFVPVKFIKNAAGTRLRPRAKLPTRADNQSAGLDLYAPEDVIVPPHSKVTVPFGIALAIPEDHYGRIAPKSGLANTFTYNTGAGVVDSGYRGEVGCTIINYGTQPFTLPAGKAIAQLILEKITICAVKEVEELDNTVRGSGGFGSSGAGLGAGSLDKVLENQKTGENVATASPSETSSASS
jgi:dUTP pyrophosphatase